MLINAEREIVFQVKHCHIMHSFLHPDIFQNFLMSLSYFLNII